MIDSNGRLAVALCLIFVLTIFVTLGAISSYELTFPIGLNMICTHPKYRRRGVAARIMQWGIDKADEMDYEMFIEAADDARHLYRKFGLVDIEAISTSRPEEESDKEWKRLEETYPFEATWMWRPKQGTPPSVTSGRLNGY
jgi:GNAT superfamily N-acetyltransferase